MKNLEAILKNIYSDSSSPRKKASKRFIKIKSKCGCKGEKRGK